MKPYNQVDHAHCWKSNIPPCGKKMPHLRCCLCRLDNPNIKNLFPVTTLKERFEKKFDGYWRGRAIPDEIAFFFRQELLTLAGEIVSQAKFKNGHVAYNEGLDVAAALIRFKADELK